MTLQDRRRKGGRSVVGLGEQYWRKRAREIRAQAHALSDPVARRALLGIADNYDELAAQAATREQSPLPDKAPPAASLSEGYIDEDDKTAT
jgi:hypothetical protein